jgi:type VI secretion system protein ImpG
MFNKHFQQELAKLRDLGAEFSRMHPAVAPMLSGMSTDPDAERLLEGVAFLTALLRQRLDDDFPEIIQELFPADLAPLPAALAGVHHRGLHPQDQPQTDRSGAQGRAPGL